MDEISPKVEYFEEMIPHKTVRFLVQEEPLIWLFKFSLFMYMAAFDWSSKLNAAADL